MSLLVLKQKKNYTENTYSLVVLIKNYKHYVFLQTQISKNKKMLMFFYQLSL